MKATVVSLVVGLLASACTGSSSSGPGTTEEFVFPPTTSDLMIPCTGEDVSVAAGGQSSPGRTTVGFTIQIKEGRGCDIESNVTVALTELDGTLIDIEGNPIRAQLDDRLGGSRTTFTFTRKWAGCAGDAKGEQREILVKAEISRIGEFEGVGMTPRCPDPSVGSILSVPSS